MSLTLHQNDVKNDIYRYLDSKENRIKLIGSAGVGKTYLTGELVKEFVQKYPRKIFVTAPTNKALAILIKKIAPLVPENKVVFKTIHSALKMKMNTNDKTGERLFTPDPNAFVDPSEDFRFAGIAVCDEVSMLNTMILDLLQDYNFPIIFIGDNKQINPVKEEISPIWEKPYPQVELTEIIRQGAGNPIIDLSRDIEMLYFKIPNVIDGGIGYNFSTKYDKSFIDDLVDVNGTDDLKYLAWMNDTVDEINRIVRLRKYKRPKRLELGETIVFNTPYGSHYTNEEVKIEQLEVITDYVNVPNRNTRVFSRGDNGVFDKIKLMYYRVNGGKFDVLHEESDFIFTDIKKHLVDNCKKYGWGWRATYQFVERFADFKYNHAITIHKSQGSTYQNTILNVGDIMINSKVAERNRLLYTGITRASHFININNVP